jgi:hypothetical protein
MNVTGCVPLAGQGLVARRGNLTALTEGTDPGPDALLARWTRRCWTPAHGWASGGVPSSSCLMAHRLSA